MAFFISESPKAPNNSGGGFLGLIDPQAPPDAVSHFFAIEFDTRISRPFNENSSSHIGIDINSLTSLKITDTSPDSGSSFYPELFLYNNYTFKTWIEYNAPTGLIQVWMTNATSVQDRPTEPCLQAYHDLSDVFKEFMYVGFTGANQPANNSIEGYVIYSWSFSSSDDFTSTTSKRRWLLPIVLPIVICACGLICCCACVWIVKRRKRNMKRQTNNEIHTPGAYAGWMPLRYTYTELDMATNGFNKRNKIGSGGSSLVYRGKLPDGSMVAVKKLRECMKMEEEFMSEMKIISRIRHRNLLQLHGWCYEREEALLVYKYMSNGSLDTYLFGKKSGSLRSETRLKILKGVASSLEYLHGGLQDCVVHRDVKAANVLLTDEFEAILGDFGLTRLIEHDTVVTMTIAGTLGYVAPEVLSRGKVTEKADVYSFGILALEVACGQSANVALNDPSETEQLEGMSLLEWVWKLHRSDGRLTEAVDMSMIREEMAASQIKEQWTWVLLVALMCCNTVAEARPTMRQVSQALQEDTLQLPSGQCLSRLPLF